MPRFLLYVFSIRRTLSVLVLSVRIKCRTKICFHDTDIFDGFCVVTRTYKSKVNTFVNTFVHAVCDLPNMTVSRKNCN